VVTTQPRLPAARKDPSVHAWQVLPRVGAGAQDVLRLTDMDWPISYNEPIHASILPEQIPPAAMEVVSTFITEQLSKYAQNDSYGTLLQYAPGPHRPLHPTVLFGFPDRTSAIRQALPALLEVAEEHYIEVIVSNDRRIDCSLRNALSAWRQQVNFSGL